MKAKLALLGVGVIIGVALLLGAWTVRDAFYKYQGGVIDPPVQAGDFELTDQNGNPFRLSDQRGKVVLIFFGYTNCPDVCPITLSEFKRIKKDLGKRAEDVRFVFITVDPERDTPERLEKHIANFDPSFIGLTGSLEDLEPVWDKFGVYREKDESGSAAGYLMGHTSIVYVLDKAGNWRLTFPFGFEYTRMAIDVAHLAREN